MANKKSNKNTTYQRKRRRAIKQKIVDYKNGCCEICKYSNCLKVLELHHRNPLKKDPSFNSRNKIDEIKFELNKCILLCVNCHREIHSKIIKEKIKWKHKKYTLM